MESLGLGRRVSESLIAMEMLHAEMGDRQVGAKRWMFWSKWTNQSMYHETTSVGLSLRFSDIRETASRFVGKTYNELLYCLDCGNVVLSKSNRVGDLQKSFEMILLDGGSTSQ